jgi:uncharacterized protein
MKLTLENVQDLVIGATFLGAGGGGDPYLGALAAQQQIARGRVAEVIPLQSVADDALVIPVAFVGAPTAFVEKLFTVSAARVCLERMETLLGRKADAVIAAEMGGLQSLVPFVVGAEVGLPVVDADGIGRAFPEIQMTTFGIEGVRAAPIVAVDVYGEALVIEASDNLRAETYTRAVCVAMGFQSMCSLYPMSGSTAKRVSVPNSATYALGIGRAIRGASQRQEDPFGALANYLRTTHYGHVEILFDGKIADLDRRTRGGWAVGSVRLTGLAGGGDRFEIDFKNEYLVARRNGRVEAIVPDLISIMDRDTAVPLAVENLKYGQRVKVVACGAPPQLRTSKALAVVGPAAFGLTESFVPLESLHPARP